MRIRKRLALSSLSTADLQLQRSEAAPPSDHSNKESRWNIPDDEEQKEHKELGDETLRLGAKSGGNNDIRKIVLICDGGELYPTSLLPSSSVQDSCYEENYEVIPLKKRKGCFERTPNEETNHAKMKSKTNKKCNNILQTDPQKAVREENGKKSKRGGVIMEGSRCSRVNGRGWRCGQPTLVGYSLCEHHLGKGRLRSMASVRRGAAMGWRSGGGEEEEEEEAAAEVMMVTKKRTKVGVVKARSMSSLLSQI